VITTALSSLLSRGVYALPQSKAKSSARKERVEIRNGWIDLCVYEHRKTERRLLQLAEATKKYPLTKDSRFKQEFEDSRHLLVCPMLLLLLEFFLQRRFFVRLALVSLLGVSQG
jgi:hypothetical protein